VDLFYKDPDAKLDYGFDWATWLGSDTISSSSWTVDAGLTQVSDTNDTTTTTVWLEGGTVGVSYKAVNRIVTVGGREEDRTLWIVVQER
jgi:hypothetical protein